MAAEGAQAEWAGPAGLGVVGGGGRAAAPPSLGNVGRRPGAEDAAAGGAQAVRGGAVRAAFLEIAAARRSHALAVERNPPGDPAG